MYSDTDKSTSDKIMYFYKTRTGIVLIKELIDEVELNCDEYIVVPGYKKTLFTLHPLQQIFKYYALLKNPLQLSIHTCRDLILNHVKINKMPMYSNLSSKCEQKIVKIFLKYLQYKYNYIIQCIPNLTKHT